MKNRREARLKTAESPKRSVDQRDERGGARPWYGEGLLKE